MQKAKDMKLIKQKMKQLNQKHIYTLYKVHQ